MVFANDQVWIVRSEDGVLQGFIAFTTEWVNHLYLLPDARGRGLGARLFAQAFRYAQKLHLWTFQRNESARKFYQRQGFSEVLLTDGAHNEEREPDVMMEWIKTP